MIYVLFSPLSKWNAFSIVYNICKREATATNLCLYNGELLHKCVKVNYGVI